MPQKEKLDYCRVKKIFDKGFGFLTSLYHQENVFFHFSGIKDKEIREKLEKQKRGELYFFYTSYVKDQKRKVKKLWLELSAVDENLIPEFVERIVDEFISGRTNPFEVAHVVKLLRENNFLHKKEFLKILTSPKIQRTPSLLNAMISKNIDGLNISKIEELVEQLENDEINQQLWVKEVANILSS